jgi:hypothetical protein
MRRHANCEAQSLPDGAASTSDLSSSAPRLPYESGARGARSSSRAVPVRGAGATPWPPLRCRRRDRRAQRVDQRLPQHGLLFPQRGALIQPGVPGAGPRRGSTAGAAVTGIEYPGGNERSGRSGGVTRVGVPVLTTADVAPRSIRGIIGDIAGMRTAGTAGLTRTMLCATTVLLTAHTRQLMMSFIDSPLAAAKARFA